MGLPRWSVHHWMLCTNKRGREAGSSVRPALRRFTSSATPLTPARWNPRLCATL